MTATAESTLNDDTIDTPTDDTIDTPTDDSMTDDETHLYAGADPFAGVPAPLAAALRGRGFEALTSVQRAVLAAESEGRDLRISSQTGSGKTIAIGFVLGECLLAEPDARRGPRVLILVPTRELAMQVRDELHWLYQGARNLGIEVVMGGTSIGLERRALSRHPQVVVGTPGRALDHIRAGALVCDAVAHVVLDESDRMLDMGFREELEAILDALPAERRTHLVSATFAAPVRKLANRFQHDALHIEGTALGVANEDIEHVAHVVTQRDAYAAVVNLLLLNEGGRCLIFVERRIDATALAEKLSADGFPVQSFSGELPQAQRTRTLGAFRDGTMKTLVSTDVAARGIDVPDIELVIHVDPPENADTYVHRSGRTGRAGRAGRSVLLVPPRARAFVSRMLGQARIDVDWCPPPSANKVAKLLRKRFRQALHERLVSDDGPSQRQIDYAKRLLEDRDPAVVVGLLLEMAQPEGPRAPLEVDEAPAAEAPTPAKGRGGRYVAFSINWGERSGAAPNRVLSHVCRRGQISGDKVGSIKVGPEGTRFEVEASVAGRFEKSVRRPDPREPRLRIVRADVREGAGGPRPGAPRSGAPGARRRPGPKRPERR